MSSVVRARAAFGAVIGMAALFAGIPVPSLAVGRACAAGQVHVAVVVDFGGVASTTSTCVGVGSRDNGAIVLAARASQLGRAAPRFGSSGLLCAIDGIPASGCGVSHGGKYAYWSYWHGSGGAWDYSNIGPAGSRAHATIVEGWRWQPNGAGNPTDPPPRARADASTICIPAPPPSPTTVAASGPPPTTSPLPESRVGGATTTGPTVVALGSPPAGGTTAPAATPTSGDGSGATTHARATTSPSGNAAARDPSTTTTGAPDLAATSARRSSGSGGPPVGLIVGVLLIGALAAGGIFVARRRTRSAS